MGSFHGDIIKSQGLKCGVLSWGHYWGPGAKIWGPFMEHLWGLFMGHLWGPGGEMWGDFIGHLWGPVTKMWGLFMGTLHVLGARGRNVGSFHGASFGAKMLGHKTKCEWSHDEPIIGQLLMQF